MPYILRKKNQRCWEVINSESGKVHSKCSTQKKGKAQIRLLEQLHQQEGAGWFGDLISKVIPKKRTAGVLPPPVRKILESIGNEPITSLTVVRTPLDKFLTGLVNVISLGDFSKAMKANSFDSMFHLTLYINNKYQYEKLDVVSLKKGNPIKKKSETMDVNIPVGWNRTIQEFIDKHKSEMGDEKYSDYDAFSNNCQDFLLSALKANGLLTNELQSFIKQPIEGIIEQVPSWTGKVSKTITDAAARVNRLIYGESVKIQKRKQKGGKMRSGQGDDRGGGEEERKKEEDRIEKNNRIISNFWENEGQEFYKRLQKIESQLKQMKENLSKISQQEYTKLKNAIELLEQQLGNLAFDMDDAFSNRYIVHKNFQSQLEITESNVRKVQQVFIEDLQREKRLEEEQKLSKKRKDSIPSSVEENASDIEKMENYAFADYDDDDEDESQALGIREDIIETLDKLERDLDEGLLDSLPESHKKEIQKQISLFRSDLEKAKTFKELDDLQADLIDFLADEASFPHGMTPKSVKPPQKEEDSDEMKDYPPPNEKGGKIKGGFFPFLPFITEAIRGRGLKEDINEGLKAIDKSVSKIMDPEVIHEYIPRIEFLTEQGQFMLNRLNNDEKSIDEDQVIDWLGDIDLAFGDYIDDISSVHSSSTDETKTSGGKLKKYVDRIKKMNSRQHGGFLPALALALAPTLLSKLLGSGITTGSGQALSQMNLSQDQRFMINELRDLIRRLENSQVPDRDARIQQGRDFIRRVRQRLPQALIDEITVYMTNVLFAVEDDPQALELMNPPPIMDAAGVQRGGFLPALALALAPTLLSKLLGRGTGNIKGGMNPDEIRRTAEEFEAVIRQQANRVPELPKLSDLLMNEIANYGESFNTPPPTPRPRAPPPAPRYRRPRVEPQPPAQPAPARRPQEEEEQKGSGTKKRGASSWVSALKQWNSQKGGKYMIPKKGTAEYDQVRKLMK